MRVVVIGAGQAGAALVARLRGQGFAGAITLIGEEEAPPYQRPPLSKGYLLGEMPADRLWLRGAEFFVDQGVELILGAAVTGIDRDAREVAVGGGRLGYDQLVLTTGAVPRRLPGAIGGDLAGVYAVRTLADVDAMRAEFAPGRRVVIVGGGYIGLEAAAVAAKLGLRVTVLEMAERILSRVAAAETSNYFRDLHQAHGVVIRERTGLERVLGAAGTRVTGVRLVGGEEVPADFVIVGVGVLPATALAEAAGLQVENGVRTDALGRTSDPAIWAAGDCASFPHGAARLRLESVGNAIDMAEAVADNILGAGVPYTAKPWFWSDQYDCKLQIAGLNAGYDRVVVRGVGDAVSHWYFKGLDLLAVDAMNDPRAYMVGKRLIEASRSVDPTALADPATDLKALLR